MHFRSRAPRSFKKISVARKRHYSYFKANLVNTGVSKFSVQSIFKAVRQLSVRQNNTKHAAGALPLNMYRKELPVGDRVTEEPSSANDIGDKQSEYDSDSSNEDSATHEEDARSRLFL